MTDNEKLNLLMRVHYRIMENPRFWYDKGLQEIDKIICKEASDIRNGMNSR